MYGIPYVTAAARSSPVGQALAASNGRDRPDRAVPAAAPGRPTATVAISRRSARYARQTVQPPPVSSTPKWMAVQVTVKSW